MKRIFTVILLVIVCTAAFAQGKYQDVVYLKNGSIIRGLIIEQVPNQSLKIETADKSVFVYKLEEVLKIAKEERIANASRTTRPESGYQAIVEAGYGVKIGFRGLNVLKLNIINGYRLNNNFSVGIGTGVRQYMEDGQSATLIPFFADLRANLTKNSITPYVAVGVGYSFDATDGFSGVGMLVNPSVGVAFHMKNKSVFSAGLGYDMQRFNFTYLVYDPSYQDLSEQKHNKATNAISLNVGISF